MPNFSAITFSRLKDEIERYLKSEYNKADMLFSPASPYGQILSVVENLHQLSILYLKNTINQFDLGDANSNNERVIKNAAILAGHIPFRGISSTGTLKFTKKTSVDLDKELPAGIISIVNKISIKNNTNGLFYSTNIGRFKLDFDVRSTPSFSIPIIQGKWELQRFTGDGKPMQTISIQDLGDKQIENFNFDVNVNGQKWTVKSHLYDLLPDEEACVVRTGFNGGIDIIFGNGGFGLIPRIATYIEIRYLTTDGASGNIYRRDLNDWKFISDVYDVNGKSVDMEGIFDIEIFNDINFGAEAENYLFTKNILPISSNNFVLALPQQYAYTLKRLGVFTYVNAKEVNGTIFIYLVPDITLFKRDDENYFSIPLGNKSTNGQFTTSSSGNVTTSAFQFDSYERSKIVTYLKSSGVIQLTKKFIVTSPKLSFYSMNVFLIKYSDATDDSVKSQIISTISDYFLTLSKVDRIPKSDIIKLISNISDIQSVSIEFVCKKNEDYHIEGIKSLMTQSVFDPSTSNSSYDPNKVIGLDPKLGDIIFDADELPVLRGNWSDRKGNFYTDDNPSGGNSPVNGAGNLCPLNIIFKGSVDPKNKNGI